ncbi:MAG: phosphoribosylaminoimidazolesuccinocarboxamide synthase [Halobacteriales archaeon]|nr:phosphoribosylaminoimidazolesuccinocarboxamide synthase [Halobacteriales archaeon]
MGSVKSLRVKEAATETSLGRGSFVFSDDYSVFDWGKMPDEIRKKGASLCAMGAHSFELLEDADVPTHYRGVVSDGEVVALGDIDEPTDEMAVELTQVPELRFDEETGEYDYDRFHAEGGENYLVPLEVVFRNAVPPGSSLRSRYEPSELGIDADDWMENETVALEEPLVEFSTKFEEKDRYLDDDEARRVSGLDEDAFGTLRETARRVNGIITEHASDVGLSHQDGKIECLYNDGVIKVADVAGTFDENRFLREGTQISKEFLRQFYKSYDPDWVSAVSDAKHEADERGVADWRELCDVKPKPLPEEVKLTASDLYRAGANVYTERELFDAPPLDDVVERIETKD